jgi:hypothetical protein
MPEVMGHRPSCRSCRHCTPPSGEQLGVCHLRQLAIHAELAADLWCHHWTPRPPRLPVTAPASTGNGTAGRSNHQLSLEKALQIGTKSEDLGLPPVL